MAVLQNHNVFLCLPFLPHSFSFNVRGMDEAP